MPFPSQFYDHHSERMVLAHVLADPSVLLELSLSAKDFHTDGFAQIFEVFIQLGQEGKLSKDSARSSLTGKLPASLIAEMFFLVPEGEVWDHEAIVKNLSWKRSISGLFNYWSGNLERADIGAVLNSIQNWVADMTTPTGSRFVTFSNVRVNTSQPPTYTFCVSGSNGSHANISFTSAQLDQPFVFRRKIREILNINPILPTKEFDSFIHRLINSATMDKAPYDASLDASICFWIRQWFKGCGEAETPEEMSHGYIERDDARWFQSNWLMRYLGEKAKIRMSAPELWNLLRRQGGDTRLIKLKGQPIRVWGLKLCFFASDEDEEPEPDPGQMEMALPDDDVLSEEDDLSWLGGD